MKPNRLFPIIKEEIEDNYVEAQVFKKSNKQESNKQQREVVNIVENEAVVTPKAVVNQVDNEKKVWAEPIKTTCQL